MPIRVANRDTLEKVKAEIQEEVHEVLIETDKQGIIIKADSLGSLEALVTILKEKGIMIRKAMVGNITKKDISDANTSSAEDPLSSVILGFNSDINKDAEEYKKDFPKINIMTNKVIYRLIEDFERWRATESKRMEIAKLDGITRPFRIALMKGMVFRQNNPAVVGIEVQAGTLFPNKPVMKNDGVRLTTIKGIQAEQLNVEKAEKDKQVAISMDNVTIGRQLNEGDVLYSDMTENEFRKMKELKNLLTKEDIELLKEISEIKRKQNPMWGV
jgi:translation initiation factor 5B